MNRSLSRAILNQGGIRNQLGGKFTEGDEIASLYDRTGSLPVARTLANYKKKRSFAPGGVMGPTGPAYDGQYVPSDPNWGVRDPDNPGRVFKDEQDLANQKAAEGDPDNEFQQTLREHEKNWKPGMPAYYDWYDPKLGKTRPIAIAAASAGAGGGEGATGGGAGTGGSAVGGGDVAWSDPEFDAELDAWNPEIDESATGGGAGAAGREPTWWEMNQRDVRRGIGDVMEGYGNVWPHLANIKDYKELPGVTAPMLQKSVPLERPDLESYRQSIIAQGRNMQNQAGYDTAQSGSQAGQRASALAKTQSELSRLAGYEGNLKSDIANKEKLANSQITARNMKDVNTYYNDVTERDLYKTRGIANERNKIAQNVLGFVKGQRQRTLDNENLSLARHTADIENTMYRAGADIFKETGRFPSYFTKNDIRNYYASQTD